MDLEGLHSFLAVAREKSISKAAQLLHVTQPTLSTRIRKLEEGLGVTLLERSWEGVNLTRYGHYFLLYAIQLVQDMDDAAVVLNKNSKGDFNQTLEEVVNRDRINIGIETNLALSFVKPVILELAQIYPDLEFNFVSYSSKQIVTLIEYGEIDLGIFYYNESKVGLQSIALIEVELLLLSSEQNFKGVKDDLSNLDLLKDIPFILFNNPVLVYFSNLTGRFFDNLFGQPPERFHLVNDINVMLEMLVNGRGYTFLPEWSVMHIGKSSPIRIIRLGDRVPNLSIHMALSKSNKFNMANLAANLSAYCANYYLTHRL